MSQNGKRRSINSQKSMDLEFLTPLPLSTQAPLKKVSILEIPRKPVLQSPEASLKLSQIGLLHNNHSMKSSLGKIQASDSNRISTKGSIYSRFSKNRESVVHYFSLLKPDQMSQSIFKRPHKENGGKRNSLRDFLTNEQLFEVFLLFSLVFFMVFTNRLP